MNSQLDPGTAPSRAEREALEEALFCTERSFDPAELTVYLPPVPTVVSRRIEPVHCVVPEYSSGDFSDTDFTPPPYPMPADPNTERCGIVTDGGVNYSLTNLAPGVFEIRAPGPAAEPLAEVPSVEAPVEPTVAQPVVEPPVEPLAVEPVAEVLAIVPAEPPVLDPVSLEVPELRDLRVEVNAGLEVLAGVEVRIGPDVLRVVGAETPRRIELMLLSPPMNGTLSRDGSALTGGSVFTQEDVDSARLSYRHDGVSRGDDSFGFGTPQGEILPTRVEIRVVFPRTAPRLREAGSLDGVESGIAARDLLESRAEATEPCGLAVIGFGGTGVWECSRDQGKTWHGVEGAAPSLALLFDPADRLRFTPREGVPTVARLIYRAWDQSSHRSGDGVDLGHRDAVGGATAFSQEVVTAVLRIRPAIALARRPVADPWSVPLSGADLVGGALAVVRLTGPGVWQFSVKGSAWRECRAVYHGRALLLEAEDRLRFVPSKGATGPVALTLRTWDGDGIRGGHSRLSTRAMVGGKTGFGERLETADWYLDPIPSESAPEQEPGLEGER